MSVLVKDNGQDIYFEISFDVYGNVYLSNQHLIYQINVDGKNMPYVEHHDFKFWNAPQINIKSFILLNDETSLAAKIKNEHDNNNDEEFMNSDEEINWYPEDDNYLNNEEAKNSSDELIDEDNINKYGHENKYFEFYRSNQSIDIHINNYVDEEIMALYDTYIYDDSLIFKSNSIDSSSIYRMRIYKNGDIYFRPIGYSERKFNLSVNNGIMKVVPAE